QFPRSINRHLSEQNGLSGLSFQLVGLPQIGHFISRSPSNSSISYFTMKAPSGSPPGWVQGRDYSSECAEIEASARLLHDCRRGYPGGCDRLVSRPSLNDPPTAVGGIPEALIGWCVGRALTIPRLPSGYSGGFDRLVCRPGLNDPPTAVGGIPEGNDVG